VHVGNGLRAQLSDADARTTWVGAVRLWEMDQGMITIAQELVEITRLVVEDDDFSATLDWFVSVGGHAKPERPG